MVPRNRACQRRLRCRHHQHGLLHNPDPAGGADVAGRRCLARARASAGLAAVVRRGDHHGGRPVRRYRHGDVYGDDLPNELGLRPSWRSLRRQQDIPVGCAHAHGLKVDGEAGGFQ